MLETVYIELWPKEFKNLPPKSYSCLSKNSKIQTCAWHLLWKNPQTGKEIIKEELQYSVCHGRRRERSKKMQAVRERGTPKSNQDLSDPAGPLGGGKADEPKEQTSMERGKASWVCGTSRGLQVPLPGVREGPAVSENQNQSDWKIAGWIQTLCQEGCTLLF